MSGMSPNQSRNKKEFDGIIFDLDGTLWDSTKPVTTAWNQALKKMDRALGPLSEKDVQGIMGLSNDKIFQKFFPEHDEKAREEISHRCRDEEVSLLKRMKPSLYPGVEEGLQTLSQHFSLFIVSNCEPQYLRTFFEGTGYQSLFKDSECFGNTLKPKSENIKSVVKRNRLASPVYIGDTAGDETAAREAGVLYFHVNYGFGSPRGECLSFNAFSELVEFFLS